MLRNHIDLFAQLHQKANWVWKETLKIHESSPKPGSHPRYPQLKFLWFSIMGALLAMTQKILFGKKEIVSL